MNSNNGAAVFGLSPLQGGMLFHSRKAPGSGVYMEQGIYRIGGPLDCGLFERAWARVIERYGILRTAFAFDQPKPMQVAFPTATVNLATHDLRGVEEAEQDRRLQRFLEEDRLKDFDLSRAPLVRLNLFRLSDETYDFVWTYHHALLDGWSLLLVLKTLGACYEALERGENLVLSPEKPFQEYVAWLQKQDATAAATYWKRYLNGFSPSASLPVMDGEGSGFARLRDRLDSELTTRLQSVAARLHVTMGTLIYGVWAVLLSRYTRQSDVVFGITVSGRPPDIEGVETMAGLFINTLPARMSVDHGRSVGDWLREFQAAQAECRQYEYTPLADIQGWGHAAPNTPLFETVVVVENYAADAFERQYAPDISRSSSKVSMQTRAFREAGNYPLSLTVGPSRELQLSLNYDRSRFSRAAIAAMMEHFRLLCLSVAEDPAQELGRMRMLTLQESGRILGEFANGPACDLPSATLCEALAASVAMAPDATAVQFADQSVSYGELCRRARLLGNYLRNAGARPESPVVLLLNQGPALMMGILGVLEAGAAYMPLDPALPASRIAFLLKDSGANLLVTEKHLQPATNVPSTVLLDADWHQIELRLESEEPAICPDNLAYLIYTSGSTGQPKGVAVSHRSALNLAREQIRAFGVTHGSRVLQFASPGFDAAVSEWTTALLAQATLVFGSRESLRPGPELVDLLRRYEIEILTLVPTAAMALDTPLLPALRTQVFAGEACPERLLRSWSVEGRRVINAYGPTETTVCATLWLAEESSLAPIGRPLANVQAYVLDSELNPVPIGVPGEIHVGGLGVARGYLGRAGLTAARFLPNPFVTNPGERIYATGDLGRWTRDGQLEFLGRLDHQVKIRGHRIEPGEIESVLCQFPGVRGAAVVVRGEEPRAQLLAYIEREDPLDCDAVRAHILGRLPEYMLPAEFFRVDKLPLTISGKLDRKALPNLPANQGQSGKVELLNPIEELIASIWSDVLQVPVSERRADFFALGGHSLLATQVISRLKKSFRVDLPVKRLWDFPRLDDFARCLAEAMKFHHAQTPPLVTRDRGLVTPLSLGQQRLWFLHQLAPESTAYHVPVNVRLLGPLSFSGVRHSLTELARRHETLRTTFVLAGSEPAQQASAPAVAMLPVVDLIGLAEERRDAVTRRLAEENLHRPFNLSSGPVWRTLLLRLAPEDHVLAIALHHIAADGWSLGILTREFAELYNAYVAGRAPVLAQLPLQYGDFAVWQRESLQGPVITDQLAYWEDKLDSFPSILFPRVAEAGRARGNQATLRLEPAMVERLQDFGRRQDATLFMLLLAAWQAVLARYSGQSRIAIGTPVANRVHPEVERLIGFFANTLVLTAEIESDTPLLRILARARETTIGAFAHQELPFDKVVEALAPERHAERNPLFQVAFAMQIGHEDQTPLLDLSVSAFDLEPGPPPFDLILNATRTASGLCITVEYDASLFGDLAVRGMLRGLERLLAAFLSSDTSVTVGAIELLDADEAGAMWELGRSRRPPAYILDSNRKPLPHGAIGQVYIHDPQQSGAPEQSSGDRGVWSDQGELVVLGPALPLVVVNGVRINPSKVERAMLSKEGVRDCAALVRQTESGESRLCIYVAYSGKWNQEDLKGALGQAIPAGFRDIEFLRVTHIPVTAGGSVNAAALGRVPLLDRVELSRVEHTVSDSAPDGVELALILREPAALRTVPRGAMASAPRQMERVNNNERGPSTTPSDSPAILEGPPLVRRAEDPVTLPEAIRRAADTYPDHGIFHTAKAGVLFEPYPHLLERSARILRGLRKHGLEPGDKVILQVESSTQFLGVYWACLLGGFVPAPVAVPPSYHGSNAGLKRLQHIIRMLGDPLVVLGCESDSLPSSAECNGLWSRWASYDALAQGTPDAEWHRAAPDALALLLFTSGSTGNPKAVMLSHDNILLRSTAVRQEFAFTSDEVSLNWMPLDHVGGIVMFHTLGVFLGCNQVEVAKESILNDPLLWPDLLSHYRATMTWAPNFAFDTVVHEPVRSRARGWDLSRLRWILNAGEAVSPSTMRGFLERFEPYGLSGSAMWPGWGMSETTSSILHANATLDALRLGAYHGDVGVPAPGTAVRVVDDLDRVVPESVTGHLQVQGTTVTEGYLCDPEQTGRSYTKDGWFRTGDAAVIEQGKVRITGRTKDQIIVRGVNFACPEIEKAIEQCEGVNPSLVFAVGVRRDQAETDQVAVFFCPTVTGQSAIESITAQIRRALSATLGIAADFVVPIDKEELPRTGIGKIQRGELKKSFEAGLFDSRTLRQPQARTLPDWFFRPIWQRRNLRQADETPVSSGAALILAEGGGLGKHLEAACLSAGLSVYYVERAGVFSQPSARRYRIVPTDPDHYQRVAEAVQSQHAGPLRVFHLWQHVAERREPSRIEDLEKAQVSGAFSILRLTRAFTRVNRLLPELNVVSCRTQRVSTSDVAAFERTPTMGLIQTLAREPGPWARVRHIDADFEASREQAERILRESAAPDHEREVAYRRGRRYVRRLELRAPQLANAAPFIPGGRYLVSGGLGGIGLEVTRYLVEQFDARLLIIGQSELVPGSEKHSALQELRDRGADVVYRAIDVCDLLGLRACLREAEDSWRANLDGVIHLAAVAAERLLIDEVPETWMRTLRPKLSGAWTLSQLLQPGGLFLAFSSINSYFGGSGFGAYSAANRALEAFCDSLRSREIRAFCYAWSQWEGAGLSRVSPYSAATKAAGFSAVSRELGVESLVAALRSKEQFLLIGLDPGNARIRAEVESADCRWEEPDLVYSGSLSPNWQPPVVRDRFGTPIRYSLRQMSSLPRTQDGSIDREALAGASGEPNAAEIETATLTERTVASIWREVLGIKRLGLDDNFFELGGHSLLATQVISRLKSTFGVTIPVHVLFDAPTVTGVAEWLDHHRHSTAAVGSFERIERIVGPSAEQLIEQLPTMREEELDDLLKKLTAERP
jgi:amino acid adenylation domain-containing protein